MNSLWQDLLFLHGHIVRNEDLVWRVDTRAETDQRKAAAGKLKSIASMCCASVWPRLAGPR